MKYVFNPRTCHMEPEKATGIRVSARQGGVMIEDYDRNIQFLINYGTNKISHCVGCSKNKINVFKTNDAMKIADKVKRLGMNRLDDKFFDYKTYSINHNTMRSNTNHILRLNEMNSVDKQQLINIYMGKKIKINYLAGEEDDTYNGREGTVTSIDDMGQLHGTWGGLAVIPEADDITIIG